MGESAGCRVVHGVLAALIYRSRILACPRMQNVWLCLVCAQRSGVVDFELRGLRHPQVGLNILGTWLGDAGLRILVVGVHFLTAAGKEILQTVPSTCKILNP